MGSDIRRVPGEVVFDGVFGLHVCELPHGHDHRHDLASKLSRWGKA